MESNVVVTIKEVYANETGISSRQVRVLAVKGENEAVWEFAKDLNQYAVMLANKHGLWKLETAEE